MEGRKPVTQDNGGPDTLFWGPVAGTVLLGILVLLNNSVSVSFFLAVILVGALGIHIFRQGGTSLNVTASVFAALAGFSLLAFQRFASVFGLFSLPLQQSVTLFSLSLFSIFLVVSTYYLRGTVSYDYLLAIPYIGMVAGLIFTAVGGISSLVGLAVLSIALALGLYLFYRQRNQIEVWVFAPYIAIFPLVVSTYLLTSNLLLQAGGGGALLGSPVPNFCAPTSSFGALCNLCGFLGMGNPTGVSCFYKSLGSLAVIIPGGILGFSLSSNASLRERGLGAAAFSTLGGLLFVTLLAIL